MIIYVHTGDFCILLNKNNTRFAHFSSRQQGNWYFSVESTVFRFWVSTFRETQRGIWNHIRLMWGLLEMKLTETWEV